MNNCDRERWVRVSERGKRRERDTSEKVREREREREKQVCVR